ncbi:MAG: glycoside hydrolase family 78 protein [Actinobacteria bacterium]|nr:glycoside hydrolase family 78 protein [Actinomycetota bacterium]
MTDWPRRWSARWIWFESPRRDGTDAFGYLRRTFDLDREPSSAACRITADGRYILWVNGTRVGRGPVRSEPAHLTYDTYDLAPLLHPGRNAIAVLVRHYGRQVVHWKPAAPYGDLGFGSLCLEALVDGSIALTSDAAWRARRAPYETLDKPPHEGPPDPEIIDGRRIPLRWTEASFDDAAWTQAVEISPHGLGVLTASPPSEPFSLLNPRPIPHLDERIVTPAAEHDSTYDFGQIVFAHPVMNVEADPGAVIELTCGEDLVDGRPVIAERSWTMRYTTGGRPGESVESFEAVGFRYLDVAVTGGGVRSVNVSGIERTYPRPDGASFTCSDTLLNDIWKAGVRTLDLCSIDAFIDCPGREQRAWLGDAFLSSLISLASNPDTDLVRWNVRLHAQGVRSDALFPMVASGDFSTRPETIPDFSLAWVWELARVWEYLGDRTAVEELLPAGLRALDWFEKHVGDDGLLTDVTGWVFIDWAQLERGRNIAALDAMYVLALDDAAMLATAIGDDGTAARLRARADRTRHSFERYWDEKRGVYVDAANPGEAAGRRVSQQTNSLAIIAGCPSRARWPRMLTRILDEERLVRTLTPGDPGTFAERITRQWTDPDGFDDERNVVLAQPYFCHFLHRALITAGAHDRLLPSIRRWKSLLDSGNGCFEEYWDAAPGLGSRAHVWSATPVYDLPTHVLGIRPASPGFATAVIEPHLGDLAFASGWVPTPHGFIHVDVNNQRLVVDLPPGVTAQVRFADASHAASSGHNEWRR